MAQMIQVDELYVLARKVLLDALTALGAHRDAIVLVGAQAVYLRVGEADLAVAPFTTDGDLAIDPAVLAESPPLERALMEAGFFAKGKDSVGIWIATHPTRHSGIVEVGIDLLVPASVSPGKGRRAANLPGHIGVERQQSLRCSRRGVVRAARCQGPQDQRTSRHGSAD